MDFFQKFPTEKVATHLKSFLGVIRNIWHGRNACDKKVIQHLLEAQCVLSVVAGVEVAGDRGVTRVSRPHSHHQEQRGYGGQDLHAPHNLKYYF